MAGSPRALLTIQFGCGTQGAVPKLPGRGATRAWFLRWQYCRTAAWPRPLRTARSGCGTRGPAPEEAPSRLWDPRTGAETARLEGHAEAIRALAVLRDGRLASGSDDKTIRLWDPRTGTETARLEGHTNAVFVLAVLPDGRL